MICNFQKLGWFCGAVLYLAASTVWPQVSRADVTYTVTDDDLTIIRMSVTPAAEPVPALKYRFLARDIDLQAGNAAPYYHRAIAEVSRKEDRTRKKYGDAIDQWNSIGADATPIGQLPLNEVRAASGEFDWIVDKYLTVAAGRRDCDWQLGVENLRGPEIVAFLLPDFQECRELCRILVLRTRLAIAERRYDDAVVAMRMNYRLAVDTARLPFLVCGLIGTAEAQVTNGTLVELIAAPESPNLYWALANLPDPLVDLRPAARFELEFGPRMFPMIDHAETTEHSPSEWNRLYTQSMHDLATLGSIGLPVPNDLGAGLAATGAALVGYSHAKARLIAQGMDRDKVEAMPVGQVMAIYTERTYQRFADEYSKLWSMPYWEMLRRDDALEKALRTSDPLGGGANREVLPIVGFLMPAMQAARGAQVRLERDVAAMQVIEALRMYTASHAGGMPAQLDEITEVPIPLNPATGQPFVYRLDGPMAILELPKSDGIPSGNRRFEIQIVKSESDAERR